MALRCKNKVLQELFWQNQLLRSLILSGVQDNEVKGPLLDLLSRPMAGS